MSFHTADILRSSCLPWVQSCRALNANRAVVTKIRRTTFERNYPDTLLVQPDGSTLRMRYNLPREIIKLPIDLDNCSPGDLKKIRKLRTQREKKASSDEVLNVKAFNPLEYVTK